MTPQDRAAPWNAATEANPYSRSNFDGDTNGLDIPADGLAYLRALDEGYKRFMAYNWNPALPYDQLNPDEQYHSEAPTTAPAVELPHPLDHGSLGQTAILPLSNGESVPVKREVSGVSTTILPTAHNSAFQIFAVDVKTLLAKVEHWFAGAFHLAK